MTTKDWIKFVAKADCNKNDKNKENNFGVFKLICGHIFCLFVLH